MNANVETTYARFALFVLLHGCAVDHERPDAGRDASHDTGCHTYFAVACSYRWKACRMRA